MAFHCPLLSPYPQEAGETLRKTIDKVGSTSLLVMGSSMGGFYATWVAAQCRCPAVLINPAVRPWLGREYLLGEQENFHTGEVYTFEQRHVEDFAAFDVPELPAPERMLVLLQTGDEVLDYRHASEKYRHCHLVVEEGGDHTFQGYERYLPEINDFWMQHTE